MDFKDLAANKRQPNTGQWILDVPEFNAWARGGGSSNKLWCYGDRMCRALDFLSTGVHSWCWEDRYCVRISCTRRRKQGAFSAQLSSNIFMHAHRMRADRVLSIFLSLQDSHGYDIGCVPRKPSSPNCGGDLQIGPSSCDRGI
jgi:hypothetical protein